MTGVSKPMIRTAVVCLLALPALAPGLVAQSKTEQGLPAWAERGLPKEGHAALEPPIGTWRVNNSLHGTHARPPHLPPIVSHHLTTTRECIPEAQNIQN